MPLVGGGPDMDPRLMQGSTQAHVHESVVRTAYRFVQPFFAQLICVSRARCDMCAGKGRIHVQRAGDAN